jgi:hypothetical protein
VLSKKALILLYLRIEAKYRVFELIFQKSEFSGLQKPVNSTVSRLRSQGGDGEAGIDPGRRDGEAGEGQDEGQLGQVGEGRQALAPSLAEAEAAL